MLAHDTLSHKQHFKGTHDHEIHFWNEQKRETTVEFLIAQLHSRKGVTFL